jgi:hypothetical protein
MNLRSIRIKPQPVPQNLEVSPPCTAIKAKSDPPLFNPIGSVKEKKVDKSDKMRISN